MKRWALCLALAFAQTGCSGARAPEHVVETFMLSLHEGRCDDIDADLAASSRRSYGPMVEAFCRQGGAQKSARKQLAGMTLIDKQEEGERATMSLQPHYADGSSGAPQRFVAVREDGTWKIDVLATGQGRLIGGREAAAAVPVDTR